MCPSEPGRPIPYLDEVELDFPELTIVGGHIGYPWTAEMISLATKYENVYIDTSAYKFRRYPRDLVDYMLFVDEAPLTGAVKGTSGFAESFVARGPRDGQGRSLRELDLRRRLFKYQCSYMIYTPAFDALPPAAKSAVYSRLWEVLSGKDASPRYKGLAPADRQAIISILLETKRDLPEYFKPVA